MAKSCHDIDILSFYLSGLTPVKVQSFGSIGHFKKSKKPEEAGDATRCLECPYESQCVWSAKKIYVEPLSQVEDRERVSEDMRHELTYSGLAMSSMQTSWTLRMSQKRSRPVNMVSVCMKLGMMLLIIKLSTSSMRAGSQPA